MAPLTSYPNVCGPARLTRCVPVGYVYHQSVEATVSARRHRRVLHLRDSIRTCLGACLIETCHRPSRGTVVPVDGVEQERIERNVEEQHPITFDRATGVQQSHPRLRTVALEATEVVPFDPPPPKQPRPDTPNRDKTMRPPPRHPYQQTTNRRHNDGYQRGTRLITRKSHHCERSRHQGSDGHHRDRRPGRGRAR